MSNSDYTVTVYADNVLFFNAGAVHTWIVFRNNITGEYELFSFQVLDSWDMLQPGSASSYDEDDKLGELMNRPTSSRTYDLDEDSYKRGVEEAKKIKDEIKSDPYKHPYSLKPDNEIGDNCVTKANEVLNEAGIHDYDGIISPGSVARINAGDFFGDYWRYATHPWQVPGAVYNYWQTAGIIIPRRDPLTLDLNGDGISTIPSDGTVLFDHEGDGLKTGSGWVNNQDGMLVLDRNGNGTIDDGGELFGDNTRKLNGNLANNAYEALASFDTDQDGDVDFNDANGTTTYWDMNHNGEQDAGDKIFTDLKLWVDANSDGITDAGELHDLSEYSITRIGTSSTAVNTIDANGNEVLAQGTYYTDVNNDDIEETHTTNSFDFVENTFYREFTEEVEVSPDVEDLPDMQGSGALRDLREAASENDNLKGVLERFSSATTRETQYEMLDELLRAWASTSDFKDFVERIRDIKIPVTSTGFGGADFELDVDFFITTEGWYNPIQNYSPMIGGENREILAGAVIGDEDLAYVSDPDDVLFAEHDFGDHRHASKLSALAKIRVLEVFTNSEFFDFSAMATNDGDEENPDVEYEITATSGGGGGGSAGGGGSSLGVMPSMIGLTEDDINIPQPEYIHAAYDQLRESVYASLVLQTRLKPYLDEIDIALTDAGDIEFDFQAFNDKIEAAIAADPVNGVLDAIDLMKYMGSNLAKSGWDMDAVMVDIRDAVYNDMSAGEREALGEAGFDLHFDAPNDTDLSSIKTKAVLAFLDDDTAGGGFTLGPVSGVVLGGSANDGYIYGKQGNDLLYGGEGNDNIHGGEGDDTIQGGAGNDANLKGGEGNDYISGGAGSDTLDGEDGDDWLAGGAGNDNLKGSDGNDVLDGGAGDDQISLTDVPGEDDQDVILFGKDDGDDTVLFSTLVNRDVVVQLKAGVDPDDVRLRRTSNFDLQIEILDEFGSVIDSMDATNVFDDAENGADYSKFFSKITSIQFSDGTVWDTEEIHRRASIGLDVSTTPSMGDRIYANDEGGLLVDLDGGDIIHARKGSDVVIAGAGDDDFDTSITSSSAAGGHDEYWFGYGDGSDTAHFKSVTADERRILVLKADVTDLSRVEISRYLSNLDIKLLDENGSVTDDVRIVSVWPATGSGINALNMITAIRFEGILDEDGHPLEIDQSYFQDFVHGQQLYLTNENYESAFERVVTTISSAEETVVGTHGHDVITATNGSGAVIEGRGGDDTIAGTSGADRIVYYWGDGNDVLDLSNVSGGGLEDTIEIRNVSLRTAQLAQDGHDLLITLNGNYGDEGSQTLRIQDYFHIVGSSGEPVGEAGTIEFYTKADDTTPALSLTPSDIRATTGQIKTTSGDDYFNAINGNGAETVYGYAGDDVLMSGGGNDLLYGGSGADTLDGGTGNDTLSGGSGNDVFRFGTGDGLDVISSSDSGDVIEFKNGISSNDVFISRASDGDFMLNLLDASGNTTDSIRIDGNGVRTIHFADEPSTIWKLEEFVAIDDKVFTIDASSSSSGFFAVSPDILINNDVAGAGSWIVTDVRPTNAPDIQYPNPGATYYFGDFWGQQIFGVILQSSGITTTFEYSIQQSNGQGGTTGPVYKGRISVNFDGDGTLTGTNGDDILDGVDGASVVMEGRGGTDTLIGGSGDDVMIHREGDGDDVIVPDALAYAGGDTLVLIGANSASDVTFAQDGRDLLVKLNGETIRIKDYTYMAAGVIPFIRLFADDAAYDDYLSDPGTYPPMATWEPDDLWSAPSSWLLKTTDGDDSITMWEGTGNDTYDGQDGNDYLNMMEGDDTLDGGDGNDTLVGGTGADTMAGGAGDDTFDVDNSLDVVNENSAEGTDTILSSINYTLGNHVENLTLGGAAISGTGNSLGNVITGNSLVNTLAGGVGNDTYVVQNYNDVVVEANGEGTDLVLSSMSFTLGNHVENLTLTGTSSYNATGNSLDNILTGNEGINTLTGGAGNDTFVVQNAADAILELNGEGTDLVQSSVSYTLGNEVENLTLTGTAAINATGNELANILTGNSLANTLNGGAGNDTLVGGAGDDVYVVDSTADVVTENASAGTDTVQAGFAYTLGSNVENLTLTGSDAINGTGNSLDNVLTGNAAVNTLAGGTGNDTYVVQSSDDVVVELASEGTDLVQAGVSYTLADHVENITLTGTSAISATGNSLNNILTGNNSINTLIGGLGDDTYLVQNGGDVVVEGTSAGTDLVISEVNYTLLANVENLTLGGSDDITGSGNSLNNILTGNSADNRLYGLDGVDTLSGGAGDDVLDGGEGADTLLGGSGDDAYLVDHSADVVTESSNEGLDWVLSSVNYTLGNHVEYLGLNGSSNLSGTGNSLDNILSGNAGINTLTGGLGDDTYVVQNSADIVVEVVSEGTDLVQASVSYTLGAQTENLTLTGNTVIHGTGNSLGNIITGNAYANTLAGGEGNDTYVVQNTNDVIVEASASGTDLVMSSVNYTLANNVENLTLTGSSNLNAVGNSLDNVLSGNSGNNTLVGGLGNDTYVVNSGSDVVTESSGQGTDTIVSSVAWTLGATVENLTLSGSAHINATGNSVDNTLVGNEGFNTLDGKAGADAMSGGDGDDLYIVDNSGDTAVESADEGVDRVESAVSFTLGNHIENLTLTGTSAINGTGNSLANIITGNTLANTLTGGAGNDTYVVQNTNDVVVESSNEGIDLVESSVSFTLGNHVENLVLTQTGSINGTGNSLANILVGGSGTNTLTGGIGNDTYYVQSSSDQLVENSAEGTDVVFSSATFTLDNHVEHLTLTGLEDINGFGNSENNILTGNDGNNTLNGQAGTDSLIGGKGDDVYVVDSTADVITELSGEGSDAVSSSVSYTLGAHLENLTLTGASEIDGVGNSLGNILTGNSDANTLWGGLGDDTYIVQDDNDEVIESSDAGTDIVLSSVTFTLGDHVEHLTLTGSGNIHGTGNGLDNILTGSTGTNTLTGHAGDDTYIIQNTGDVIKETIDEGTDLIISSVTYSISSNIHVEHLTLTGGSAINATGNSLDNILTGNSLANTLTGGDGNDTYIIQNSTDVVVEANGEGTDLVQSSVSYTLGNYQDNLSLTSTAAINATGNADANVIVGNVAINLLNGGAGADTLQGGGGDDTYIIDNTDDTVIEFEDQGTDLIQSSVSFALGTHQENLTLTGGDAIDGTGNDAANILTGNSVTNTLAGGLGNDTYIVQNSADFVLENTDEGNDEVQSSVSYTLADQIEYLVLTGGNAIDGTGNSIANTLTGNSLANTLAGGEGDDRYIVQNTNDLVIENAAEGFDAVESAVSFTIGEHTEQLTLTGSSTVNATGGAGSHILIGNSVANTLDGGAGADTLMGGLGNDVYVVDDAADVVIENLGEGTDLVESSISYTLAANLENITLTGSSALNATGNLMDNILTGNSGVNTLSGGIGNDTYVVQNTNDVIVEGTNEGTDLALSSVSYTLASGVENLTLTGGSAINGTGNASNNILTGNSLANTLTGAAGDDTYVLQNADDIVVEVSGEGYDLVQTSFSYTLGDHLEHLTLTGADAVNGTGNSLANTLTGNSVANTLDGGSGTDRLIGGFGDDVYIVDASSDDVIESRNEGIDTVVASANYSLSANIEELTLTGSSAINGGGNALANVITGNAGINTLTGGMGNDTYIVQTAGDTVVESAFEGIDRVESSVSFTLDNHVENLTLTGSSAINGTGNNSANILTGNSGVNTLTGGQGSDTYIVQNTDDVVVEASNGGYDLVQSSVSYTLSSQVDNLTLTGSTAVMAIGNSLVNILVGNSINNTLDGGAGNDTLSAGEGDDVLMGGTGNDIMSGGVGNDTYDVNSTGDTVTELSGEGTDTVLSSVTLTLENHVENLTLSGSSNINGTGNSLNNILTGNTGHNTLNGGSGTDTLIGGSGDDTYVVDSTTDTITELSSEGTDLVSSTVSYTLGSYLENLTLTGSSNIHGTGNSLDNVLTGNSGDNSLTGGVGNDTYVVQDTGDMVIEQSGEGTDLIQSSVTYTASAHVENLTLTGSGSIHATGNSLDNILTGGSGANTLSGAAGADSLVGLGGADHLYGGAGSDAYLWSEGNGNDVVHNYDSGAAGGDVDTLKLTGTSSITDYRNIWFTLSNADGQSDYNDLVVSFLNNSAQIMVEDWSSSAEYQLDKIRFDNGSIIKEATNDQTSGSDNFDALITAMNTFGTPPSAGWYTTIDNQAEQDLLDAMNAVWNTV